LRKTVRRAEHTRIRRSAASAGSTIRRFVPRVGLIRRIANTNGPLEDENKPDQPGNGPAKDEVGRESVVVDLGTTES
jgi:hypothetical protein